MSWIEIARTGRWTAMNGASVDITPEKLDGLVATFDEAERRVPLVFGHPALDTPAFGWVERLKREGATLLASLKEVPGAVKDLVAAGHYRNVSIKIGPDGKLWHIGLLGAVQPAIPGLAGVHFRAFSESSSVEALMRPQPFSTDAGLTIEFAGPNSSKEETMDIEMLKKELEALKAKIAELEALNKKLQDELAAAQGEAGKQAQAFAAYKGAIEANGREERFAKLVSAGKCLPAEKGLILELAAHSGASDKSIEFAAGGKISLEEAYWKSLEERQPNSLGQEFATPERAGVGEDRGVRVDLSRKV